MEEKRLFQEIRESEARLRAKTLNRTVTFFLSSGRQIRGKVLWVGCGIGVLTENGLVDLSCEEIFGMSASC